MNKQDDSRRVDVFFYGLFMDEVVLRHKGIEPMNRRLASVKDFALVIGQRATLVPSAGDTAYGIVFSLTHEEVESLYGEASVKMYRPEAVLAHVQDGNVIAALCFNLPKVDLAAERNREYATKLKDLAIRLTLPRAYVDKI